MLYNFLFKLDEAIVDFTKAIELDPNNAEAYYQRAEVYNYMGRQNAEEYKPDNQRPFYDMALKDLDKCLQLQPDHEEAKKLNRTILENIWLYWH